MSHELATTADGRAAIAYVGQTPWHSLGQQLQLGADLSTWQHEAGLDWEAKLATVKYARMIVDHDGVERPLMTDKPDSRVVYRNDTGVALGVVSDRYQPVQPRETIEFFRDLTEKWGFTLETAGALKGGRKIWALAKTDCALQLRGKDDVKGFLLLSTTYDGSGATKARFTPIRVVCNNTFTLADNMGVADVTVAHSTSFDADQVKATLQIGDAWGAFSRQAEEMSRRIVTRDESVRFFMDVYYGLSTREEIAEAHADEAQAKNIEKTMQRLSNALYNSPGANMESARGLLWGLVNATVYDVDFAKPARTQENRLDAAWFGTGATIKRRAWNRALAML